MKIKNIAIRLTGILLCISRCFTGCGEGNISDTKSHALIAPAQAYHIEKEVSLEMDADLLHDALLTRDSLYYRQEDDAGVSRLYKQLWKLGASAVELITLPAGERLENFTLTDNEELLRMII